MAFETPIPIMAALKNIDQGKYALPSLQREFVWKPEQICRLFDSIMKGYPIGSFLFWKLEPETAKNFEFYQFMRDYHERDNPFCAKYPMITKLPESAVLDGQQRLTAFNIGIYGSYAQKRKYIRYDAPNAYPVKHLYLNLFGFVDPDEIDEDGMTYDFRFLTEREAERQDDDHYWFRVGDLRQFKDLSDLFPYMAEKGLGNHPTASKHLSKLHTVLHVHPLVSYYEEKDQDLDKVLNIFIRINSGGTQLGYADLLLSIATTQWNKLDAREVINNLTETMNSYGRDERFNFSKDFVLKAGLMLTDRSSIKFDAKNFTSSNMGEIESNWDKIALALELTARLLDSFGLGRKHMRAASAALVPAYYLYHRGYDERFLERTAHAEERAQIRLWITHMSLTSVWSGGYADKLVPKLREELRQSGVFNREALLECTRRIGKDPYLDSHEIDELLELEYGNHRTSALLSMLYDFVKLDTSTFHIDHIYPRTLCRASKLIKAGVDQERAKRIEANANKLPNLWLLQGTQNIEKSGKLPLEWLNERYPDAKTRTHIIESYQLQELGPTLDDFETFYQARAARLRPMIEALIGRKPTPPQAEIGQEPSAPVDLSEPSAAHTHTARIIWSEGIMGILEERHHPLAQALMAAGIAEPADVDLELTQDGIITAHRSVMNWSKDDQRVWLIEPHTPHEGIPGQVIVLDADHQALAKRLHAALHQ